MIEGEEPYYQVDRSADVWKFRDKAESSTANSSGYKIASGSSKLVEAVLCSNSSRRSALHLQSRVVMPTCGLLRGRIVFEFVLGSEAVLRWFYK